MAKKIKFFFGIFAVFVLISAIALMTMREKCIVIRVPGRMEIFTESKLASNKVASLNPNDMIYLCGE